LADDKEEAMTRPAQQDLTTTTGSHDKLFLGVDTAASKWRLGLSDGGIKVRKVTVTAGDYSSVDSAVMRAKKHFGLPATCPVVSCYEAGRDGFSIHRGLTKLGYENKVVDPASIEVDRRQKQVKTDNVDTEKLTQQLIRHEERGDRFRAVCVPSVEEEDARRPVRELERLKKERTAHLCRIQSLLVLLGIKMNVKANFTSLVGSLRTADGELLPVHLREELEREGARFDLVREQIRAVEKAREVAVKEKETKAARIAAQLAALRGIGMVAATTFSSELFAWRTYQNRRQVGASVGLTGTPFASGTVNREQGISKAGNRHVRAVLIETAWAWLRYQPLSALTHWYETRFAHNGARQRRVGIVAVARKLAIALWRYVDQGIVPEGAMMKTGR
jgi:transposase